MNLHDQGVFVTATGTGVGKTLIACIIAHQLHARGRAVRVLKPVITGFDEANLAATDTGKLLAAIGKQPRSETVIAASPWRFRHPVSPDMAAARAGQPIDFGALVQFCGEALAPGTVTVIEGVGGVMVPLTCRETVRDLIAATGLPALVVTGSYLGALSHTLTAVEALRARRVPIAAVVVNETADSPVPLGETARSIANFIAPVPVTALGRLTGRHQLWEGAPDLTGLVPRPASRAVAG